MITRIEAQNLVAQCAATRTGYGDADKQAAIAILCLAFHQCGPTAPNATAQTLPAAHATVFRAAMHLTGLDIRSMR